MKKFSLKIALILIALMAFSAKSEAITVKFTLNITDNCPVQPYYGNYVAYITITYDNGPVLCSYTTPTSPCTLTQGGNTIIFSCDIEPQGKNCLYEINVRVCRCTTPACCGNNIPTELCWYQLYTPPYQSINVTL
jgi:hypothetical protein